MYLDTLLDIVTPQLFAQEYADINSIYSDGADMLCSFKEVGTVRFHANGFVAENLQGSIFKAGSIIDIRAIGIHSTKGWPETYREAVKSIVRKFKNILPVGMCDPQVIDYIADRALKKRRVYNSCVCKSRPLYDLPGGLTLRANNDLGGLLSIGGVSFLNNHDLKLLEGKLKDIGISVSLPNVSVLLVPYFSNAYDIACIELIYGKKNSTNEVIWLNNKEIAIAGLLGIKNSSHCFLENNLNDAILDMKRSTEENTAFFSIIKNPDGEGVGWIPNKFFYVYRSNNPLDLITPSNLVIHGANCVVTKYPSIIESSINQNSLSWGDAVAEAVIDIIEKNGDFTPQSNMLLKTVKLNKNVKIRIKERLEATGNYWLSDKLETTIRDGAIWQDSHGCLYNTANGYLWEDSEERRFGGSLITNFTIEPTYSARYETGEMYRGADVTVGTESRPLLLPPSSLDTVKKLAESVESYIALSSEPTIVTPAIFDQTKSRPILTWMQKKYSELPVKIGTSYIGWNPTRTKFIGTGFRNDPDLKHNDCLYRPGISYLEFFTSSSDLYSTSPIHSNIPDELLDIVYACAGIITRSYSGHVVSPVLYKSDQTTRDTLQRIFLYAGQLRAVQLNKNMRSMGDIDCIQGYPFVAIGYNRSQAKACKTGMLLLGEEGTELGTYTEDVEKLTGAYIRYIIENIPTYLIKNCGPSFVPYIGNIPESILLEEGKKIIDEMSS